MRGCKELDRSHSNSLVGDAYNFTRFWMNELSK